MELGPEQSEDAEYQEMGGPRDIEDVVDLLNERRAFPAAYIVRLCTRNRTSPKISGT